jgi:Glycosyltransferase family 92
MQVYKINTNFPFPQALYLLEFLELNALLGVSHFTLYNHTIGPKASCVLKHYMDGNLPFGSSHRSPNVSTTTASPLISQLDSNNIDGMLAETLTTPASDSWRPPISVTLLPWNLKMRSQKEIRTEGLFASLNDCLYRSMYR